MTKRVYALAATLLVGLASALTEPPPQRIVSTAPAFTEMLFSIGAGTQVVGVTSFCSLPSEATRIQRLGGYADLSFEKLLSLKPDLVIMADYNQHLRQQCEAAKVASLALKAQTVEDVLAAIKQIGGVSGHSAKADDVANGIKARLTQLQKVAAKKTPRRTMILIGRIPGSFQSLLAVGPGGFLDQLLTIAGGSNVLADTGQPWPQIGLETVLTRKPETIIELVDNRSHRHISDQEVVQRKVDWKQFTNLPAVEHGRVHVLRDDQALIPGPRIADIAAELAELLQ